MTTFELAFNKIISEHPEYESILLEKLKEWEMNYGWKSKRVVENFKDEHFLSVDHMEELMLFIILRKDKVFDAIKTEMRTLIYNKYQLQGESIKQTPYPETVGFAISVNEYKDFLMRSYGQDWFDSDENEVEKFIINYSQGIYDDSYSDFLFKNDFKIVWMTWEKTSDVHNPFYFMKYNKSEEVTVTLGLDNRYFKPPLLLFLVDVTKVNELDFKMYRPTFCDSDFYENFKPPPLDFKDHGLTQPLVGTISDNGNSYNPERRPETVVRSQYVKLDKVKKVIYLNR